MRKGERAVEGEEVQQQCKMLVTKKMRQVISNAPLATEMAQGNYKNRNI